MSDERAKRAAIAWFEPETPRDIVEAEALEKHIAEVYAPLVAENERLRRRLEMQTCPVPNMAEVTDVIAERDRLAKQVERLREAAEAVLAGDYVRMYDILHRDGHIPCESPSECEWHGGGQQDFMDVVNARDQLECQLLRAVLQEQPNA